MSSTALNAVWEQSAQSGDRLVVMHILADNADDAGALLIPDLEYVARRARIDRERLNEVLAALEFEGELVRGVEDWRVMPRVLGYPSWYGRTTKEKRLPRPGYVYILKSDSGARKIGRAVNPENRLKTFAVGLPFRVEYELLIYSEDHVGLEHLLHERFASKRIEYEWFALTDDDVMHLRREYGAE
jgi:hypothetical protein